MSEPVPVGVLAAQVAALLQRVTQQRERRTREIRASTDTQKREIIRGAHAEARENLHQAIARERARLAQGLRQAQARAELEARRRAQLETRTLLRNMWEGVDAELEARWRAERARHAWIAAAVQDAGELLGGRAWRIEHGAGVSAEDRRRGEDQARAAGARDVEWHLEPQIRAGLRIRTPGACLDATIEGLLAAREDVEAAFLSEYLDGGGPTSQRPTPAAAPTPLAQGRKP